MTALIKKSRKIKAYAITLTTDVLQERYSQSHVHTHIHVHVNITWTQSVVIL